jgi:hypothetical protein
MGQIEYCDSSSELEFGRLSWYQPEATRNFPQDEVDEWLGYADRRWFPQQSSEERTVAEHDAADPVSLLERYATEWERQTSHVSSVDVLISHPNYKAIIDLGWPIVPQLINELSTKHRFWFPALEKITGIRPFDLREAGNSRRMTKAWTDWGRKKRLIK